MSTEPRSLGWRQRSTEHWPCGEHGLGRRHVAARGQAASAHEALSTVQVGSRLRRGSRAQPGVRRPAATPMRAVAPSHSRMGWRGPRDSRKQVCKTVAPAAGRPKTDDVVWEAEPRAQAGGAGNWVQSMRSSTTAGDAFSGAGEASFPRLHSPAGGGMKGKGARYS